MRILKSLVVAILISTAFSCANQKADVKFLETEIDSASYALGMDMAIKVKQNFKEANTEMFLQGYRNTMDSTNMLIEQKDLGMFLRTFFQKQQMEKQKEMAAKNFSENKKAGEKFLAENKTKEGVITTESGLQYIVLKEGTGRKPQPTDTIKINYHGTTINGDVFDSTIRRNKPYVSKANVFVPGFNEALLNIKVGGKHKVFIPQELAYGFQQRGQLIKPYSPLVFEIELLEITND